MKLNKACGALLLPLVLLGASACGSSVDRAAQARSTVQNYWDSLAHLQTHKAYGFLSPGVRGTVAESQYRQDMVQFLENAQGVDAHVGKVKLVGDCALVAVGLTAAKAPGGIFRAYQHLYWLNGHWVITEPNGGVTQHPGTLTCPTGT